MGFAMILQRSDHKTKSRIICAAAGFVLLAPLNVASAMDPMDRKMEMDMNRDRAESRIERLHEDQRRNRPANKKATKKTAETPKHQRQRLQY
jgi:hypothetical protein